VIGEALTNVGVFTTAANAENRLVYFDLQLLHTDTREVHFHDPTLRRTVDVGGGIPETT
jgi:hypothetical protein